MEQLKKGQVDECDLVGSFSSSNSESEISSGSSLEFDSYEEVTSSASSSSSSANQLFDDDSFSDMSSLFQQLPIKRGLSKYYQGKAQSFTSLAKVSSLVDLVKPEISHNKKLKSCKSYGEEQHIPNCTISAISSYVSKRRLHPAISRGSCSSLRAKGSNNNFIGSTPPIPFHLIDLQALAIFLIKLLCSFEIKG